MILALASFLGSVVWAQTSSVERFDAVRLQREVVSMALGAEDARLYQVHRLALRRPLGGYSPWAFIEESLHRFVDGRDVELFYMTFAVTPRTTGSGGWAVGCEVVDWQSERYLHVQDCEVTQRSGTALTEGERALLPSNMARLGPRFFSLIMYEELGL